MPFDLESMARLKSNASETSTTICDQNPICMQMVTMLRNPSQMPLDVFGSSVQASLDNRLGRLLRITRQQLMFLLADAVEESSLVLSSSRRFDKYVAEMISRTKVSKSYSVFLRKLESVANTGKFPYKSERRYGWRLAGALYTHGTTGLPTQLADLLNPTRVPVPFPTLDALRAAGNLLGSAVSENQTPRLPDTGQRRAPRFMVTYETTVEFCVAKLEQPFDPEALTLRLKQWHDAAVLAGFRALPTAQPINTAPIPVIRHRPEEDEEDGPLLKRQRRADVDVEDVELLQYLSTPPGSPMLDHVAERVYNISPTWSILSNMSEEARGIFDTLPDQQLDTGDGGVDDHTAAILSAIFSDTDSDSSC